MTSVHDSGNQLPCAREVLGQEPSSLPEVLDVSVARPQKQLWQEHAEPVTLSVPRAGLRLAESHSSPSLQPAESKGGI